MGFPANFEKFLRSPFLQETSERLLLCVVAEVQILILEANMGFLWKFVKFGRTFFRISLGNCLYV